LFTSASAAAAFAGIIRERVADSLPVRLLENGGEFVSAVTGLGMSSYTGVLIGATAIPVWNKNVDTLPLHFAASGLGAAVSILELAGHDAAALNLLGIGSALAESVEGLKLESQDHEVNRPLRQGSSGWITRAGGVLSGPAPLVLRLLAAASGGQRARDLRRHAAIMTVAGSLLTRVGWLRAGHASARDYRLPLEIDSVPKLPPGAEPALPRRLTTND
jgi:formate-dependent nitrite reductase membrane component NrfD